MGAGFIGPIGLDVPFNLDGHEQVLPWAGIGCSRSDMESEDVSRWGRFDGDLVGVARPDCLGYSNGDVKVETEEQSGRFFVGRAFVTWSGFDVVAAF